MEFVLSSLTVQRIIGIPDLCLFWSLAVVVVVIVLGLYSNKVSDKRKFPK